MVRPTLSRRVLESCLRWLSSSRRIGDINAWTSSRLRLVVQTEWGGTNCTRGGKSAGNHSFRLRTGRPYHSSHPSVRRLLVLETTGSPSCSLAEDSESKAHKLLSFFLFSTELWALETDTVRKCVGEC